MNQPALVGVKPGGPDSNPGGGALEGVPKFGGGPDDDDEEEDVGPNKSWARKSSNRLSYFVSSTKDS